jgi:hypothetical protein
MAGELPLASPWEDASDPFSGFLFHFIGTCHGFNSQLNLKEMRVVENSACHDDESIQGWHGIGFSRLFAYYRKTLQMFNLFFKLSEVKLSEVN